MPMKLDETEEVYQGGPSEDRSDPRRSLTLLAHYLTLLLENCATSSAETMFVWDWEMVREAINPYTPSNVFSGVLWQGLGTLDELNDDSLAGKVVYAEGTRRELLWHLSSLATGYRKRLRLAKGEEEIFKTAVDLAPYAAKRDWKKVLSQIGKLMRLDESLDRLLLLLERYAEPMPLNASEIPLKSVRLYENELRNIRRSPDFKSQNEADAWNLASTESLSHLHTAAKRPVELITATRAVRSVAKGLARDPFYFALELQLRRDFPDRQARETVLHEMLARLHTLAARFGALRNSTRGGPLYMGRSEVSSVFESFKTLSVLDDPLLREVWTLVVRAAQALEDSRFQSKSVSDALDYTAGIQVGLGNFENKINAALRLLETPAPSAQEMSLQWHDEKVGKVLHRHRLLSHANALVMEAELRQDSVVLCWASGVTLKAFLDTVAAIWTDTFPDSPIRVIVQCQNSQQTELKLTDAASILEAVRSTVDSRITLVRIITGRSSFWYDIGEQLTPVEGKVRLGDARVAITSYLDKSNTDVLLKLYNDTARRWIYPSVLKDAVETLLESGGRKRD